MTEYSSINWSKLATNRTKYMDEYEIRRKGFEIFVKPLRSGWLWKKRNLRLEDIIRRFAETVAVDLVDAADLAGQMTFDCRTYKAIGFAHYIEELICPDDSKIYRIHENHDDGGI